MLLFSAESKVEVQLWRMDKNLRWQVLEEDAEITQKKYLMLWFEWD
jgi:hypothetical protein